MKPAEIVKVAATYSDLATVNRNDVTGMEFKAEAVVVFDTRSAIIELDDENSNAEASAAIATFRQGMPSNPLIVVGHIGKALKRADVKDLSSRGAGAWEADVQQVLYLVNDEGTRWLDVANPKHRFVAQVDGIEFDAYKASVAGVDQLGNPVDIALMHGVPKLVGLGERGKDRAEQAAADLEAIRKGEESTLRIEVMDRVGCAWATGNPINREGLKVAIKGFRTARLLDAIETLIHEQWLLEVSVPPRERIHPKRSGFLVRLTEEERRLWMESGQLPQGKLLVPPSWKKPISIVPDATALEPETGGGDV
jgi:hypothetical protein